MDTTVATMHICRQFSIQKMSAKGNVHVSRTCIHVLENVKFLLLLLCFLKKNEQNLLFPFFLIVGSKKLQCKFDHNQCVMVIVTLERTIS